MLYRNLVFELTIQHFSRKCHSWKWVIIFEMESFCSELGCDFWWIHLYSVWPGYLDQILGVKPPQLLFCSLSTFLWNLGTNTCGCGGLIFCSQCLSFLKDSCFYFLWRSMCSKLDNLLNMRPLEKFAVSLPWYLGSRCALTLTTSWFQKSTSYGPWCV